MNALHFAFIMALLAAIIFAISQILFHLGTTATVAASIAGAFVMLKKDEKDEEAVPA